MPATNEFDQPVGDPVPDWTPRPWPSAVSLIGAYVALEPLALEHASHLYDALCGPHDRSLWTYRATDPPVDEDAMAAFISTTLASDGMETFVLLAAGGTPAGIASFMRIDTATGQIEVGGVLYAHDLQRTTAATEAIHLLMRHAFDDLGYRRFEWKCDSLNEPSRRAATRLGFTYEGRFRRHMIIKGLNRDTDWFSVTDAEWSQLRTHHERWLDPANFDDSGAQRMALTRP